MKASTFTRGLLVGGMVFFGAACGGNDQPATVDTNATDATTADATTPAATGDMAGSGQAIFTGAGLCSTCHGPDAMGTALAPDLTDDVWLNLEQPITQDKIVSLIRTGVPAPKEHPAPMPPMGGASLTDDQINEVASYVMSLHS